MLRNAEFTQPETIRACRPPLPGARWPSRKRARRSALVQPVGCVELAMTHRSASLTTRGARETWFAPNVPLEPVLPPHAPRPTPFAVGRKMGSFFCSIPHSFVLSHNMPRTNTTSNWLCLGAFLRGPAESTRRCADSTSRLPGDGYGCHAHAQSEHGEPWRYTIRRVSSAGMAFP